MNSWWAQQSAKRGELEKRSEWLWQWNVREVVVRPASGEDPAQLCWFVNNRPFGALVLDAACEVRVLNDSRLVVKSGPSDTSPRRELHLRLRGGLRSPASAPESLQSWCDAIEEAARPQNAAEAVATASVRLVSLAAGPRAARSFASWLGDLPAGAGPPSTTERGPKPTAIVRPVLRHLQGSDTLSVVSFRGIT